MVGVVVLGCVSCVSIEFGVWCAVLFCVVVCCVDSRCREVCCCKVICDVLCCGVLCYCSVSCVVLLVGRVYCVLRCVVVLRSRGDVSCTVLVSM